MNRRPAAGTPSPPSAGPGHLDERIRGVELRLMAREDRLHRRLSDAGLRLRESVRPRRLLPPLIGAAGALFVLWRLLRGRPRPLPAAVAAPPPAAGELPWVGLVALLWPSLPERWQRRISPATATSVASFGVPLIEALLRRRPKRRPPEASSGHDGPA